MTAVASELDPAARSRITFRQDRIRGACQGVLETGVLTFGLIVAIRYFDASQTTKAFVSAAHPIGLLLTPVSLFLFARWRWVASKAACVNLAIAGVFLLLAASAPTIWMFVSTLVIGSTLIAQQPPLLVHMYSTNYAPSHRGRMLSNSIFLSLITAIAFSWMGGRALDADIGSFRWMFVVMAVASFGASWAVSIIPADPFSRGTSNNPLAALRFAWEDRVFGAMLFVWMLMGLGNLMTLPLRIEYMANPIYGVNASNTQIAIVTAVIPSIVRLATTHFWGIIFDRFNFFILRTILNSFFLVAILLFFSSHTLPFLCIAGGLYGLALAGGNIAWNLWVTKFAPPERASDYMSVHTFLTGVRGVAAPFIGFWFIAKTTPTQTSYIAAGLILASMVLLDPLRRKHKNLDCEIPQK